MTNFSFYSTILYLLHILLFSFNISFYVNFPIQMKSVIHMKIKKMYKEVMMRPMSQEQRRKVKKVKKRLNCFDHVVVVMIRLSINISSLHACFQVLLLTVNMQKSSNSMSFYLIAIVYTAKNILKKSLLVTSQIGKIQLYNQKIIHFSSYIIY